MTKKIKIVCAQCGGENITKDASASWNVETQEWELVTTFDKANNCEDCNGDEVDLEEIPIDTNTLFQFIGIPDESTKSHIDDDGDVVIWFSAPTIEIAQAYIDKRGWKVKEGSALHQMDRVTDPDDPDDSIDVWLNERGEVLRVNEKLKQ